MSFHIPVMKLLSRAASSLNEAYQRERQEKDSHRFLSSLRSNTHNPKRLEDINFVEAVEMSVTSKKIDYDTLDPEFQYKDYDKFIAPFLKKVMAGALLLDLTAITKEYSSEESVKSNSALGKIILDVFGIDKLSDAPEDERVACFKALKRYLEVIISHTAEPIKWHANKTNDQLIADIEHEIRILNTVSSKTYA